MLEDKMKNIKEAKCPHFLVIAPDPSLLLVRHRSKDLSNLGNKASTNPHTTNQTKTSTGRASLADYSGSGHITAQPLGFSSLK